MVLFTETFVAVETLVRFQREVCPQVLFETARAKEAAVTHLTRKSSFRVCAALLSVFEETAGILETFGAQRALVSLFIRMTRHVVC